MYAKLGVCSPIMRVTLRKRGRGKKGVATSKKPLNPEEKPWIVSTRALLSSLLNGQIHVSYLPKFGPNGVDSFP